MLRPDADMNMAESGGVKTAYTAAWPAKVR